MDNNMISSKEILHSTESLPNYLLQVLTTNLTCPICQELFTNPIRLKCGHTYCEKCILKWAEKKNYGCPICRVQFTHEEETKIISQVLGEINKDLIALNLVNGVKLAGQIFKIDMENIDLRRDYNTSTALNVPLPRKRLTLSNNSSHDQVQRNPGQVKKMKMGRLSNIKEMHSRVSEIIILSDDEYNEEVMKLTLKTPSFTAPEGYSRRIPMRNINNDNIQNGSPLGRFREEIIDLEEFKEGKDHMHNLEGLKGNWNWNNNHWEEKMKMWRNGNWNIKNHGETAKIQRMTKRKRTKQFEIMCQHSIVKLLDKSTYLYVVIAIRNELSNSIFYTTASKSLYIMKVYQLQTSK